MVAMVVTATVLINRFIASLSMRSANHTFGLIYIHTNVQGRPCGSESATRAGNDQEFKIINRRDILIGAKSQQPTVRKPLAFANDSRTRQN